MAKEGLLEQFCSVYKVPRESIRIIEGCRDDIFRFFEDKKELFLSFLLKLKEEERVNFVRLYWKNYKLPEIEHKNGNITEGEKKDKEDWDDLKKKLRKGGVVCVFDKNEMIMMDGISEDAEEKMKKFFKEKWECFKEYFFKSEFNVGDTIIFTYLYWRKYRSLSEKPLTNEKGEWDILMEELKKLKNDWNVN